LSLSAGSGIEADAGEVGAGRVDGRAARQAARIIEA
jgi:hypothetical protein